MINEQHDIVVKKNVMHDSVIHNITTDEVVCKGEKLIYITFYNKQNELETILKSHCLWLHFEQIWQDGWISIVYGKIFPKKLYIHISDIIGFRTKKL